MSGLEVDWRLQNNTVDYRVCHDVHRYESLGSLIRHARTHARNTPFLGAFGERKLKRGKKPDRERSRAPHPTPYVIAIYLYLNNHHLRIAWTVQMPAAQVPSRQQILTTLETWADTWQQVCSSAAPSFVQWQIRCVVVVAVVAVLSCILACTSSCNEVRSQPVPRWYKSRARVPTGDLRWLSVCNQRQFC